MTVVNARSALETLRERPAPRVAVLGDVILDKFLWGEVDRISPEAPVPVLDFREETYILGGAATVEAGGISTTWSRPSPASTVGAST